VPILLAVPLGQTVGQRQNWQVVCNSLDRGVMDRVETLMSCLKHVAFTSALRAEASESELTDDD
jgi:hypothetical protein